MPLTQLHHYTIRPRDMEETREFYERVLGLPVGPRPDLGFPGYWLYLGDVPVVHLVPNGRGQLGSGSDEDDTGNFDHIAFLGNDFDGMKAHLEKEGVAFRFNDPPNANLRQLFIRDPNYVMVELNFPGKRG